MRTVIILSISSDIGMALARRYLKDGYRVIGTYRNLSEKILDLKNEKSCILLKCDIKESNQVKKLFSKLKKLKISWNTFISCVGEPRPLTPFFSTDFDNWRNSFELNSVYQLRVLHALYPLKGKGIVNVVFFAGGGINKTVIDFSAYTLGKIALVKMCEYLDAEEKNLNIFTVGPGWTRTKTHELIIKDPKISQEKKQQTLEFLKSGKGTDINYIYECIRWLSDAGKPIVSGRNFALAHDPLQKGKRENLAKRLKGDNNMYKLRRYGSKIL